MPSTTFCRVENDRRLPEIAIAIISVRPLNEKITARLNLERKFISKKDFNKARGRGRPLLAALKNGAHFTVGRCVVTTADFFLRRRKAVKSPRARGNKQGLVDVLWRAVSF